MIQLQGLNLGCGSRVFKTCPEIEWTNIDAVGGPGVDVKMDIREVRTITRRNEVYDIIIAHQCWEHMQCGEQPIKACYELLKPTGCLIVSVPDLEKLALMWLAGELTTQIYLTNIYGPFNGTEESIHRWGFDADYLVAQMKREAPWYKVDRFDYRTIPGAEIARDDRWILCVEGVK